jgi:superfamily II DNA or RNA helicase
MPQLAFDLTPRAAAGSGGGMGLRPYQLKSLENVEGLEREGENRLIMQMATGLGKTVVFSELARRKGQPTLILAHRDELLSQAIAKLRMVWPDVDVGRVQAERNETGHLVTVSSVQTLSRDRRFEQAFPDPGRLALLVTDEGHHSFAPTYKKIYQEFGLMERAKPGAPLHLGVTATPIRGDKQSLGEVYDRFAFKMGIKEGIKSGYLCDLAGYVLHFSNEDFADVHVRGGDYVEQELDQAIKNVARCEAIVACWKERAQNRHTVVFCLSIQHAQMVCESFIKAGVKADVVFDSLDRDTRHKVLADFEDGRLEVLCNCMILTEGWDVPKTDCVIMARPTKNQSLYIQCVGRGTRPFPQGGKQNCLVIDVADISKKMSVHVRATTLDKALELKKEGEEAKEVQSALDLINEEGFEGEGLGKTMKFRDTKGGSEFNPLDDPFDQDVAGVRLRWTMGGTGLTFNFPQLRPDTKHYLVIKRRKDWLWDVIHVKQIKLDNGSGHPRWTTVGEKFANTHGLPDDVAAARFAESYAGAIVPDIFNKALGRDWRSRQPATGPQLEILRDRKLPTLIDGRPITKSEASVLIDNLFAKKVKVRLDRLPGELDIY